VLVLAAGNRIVAVLGSGIDDRVKITPSTRRAVRVRYRDL
jgi:hypothetical protein